MHPTIPSDTVGIVLRDPDGALSRELKAAHAARKPIIIRGTGKLNRDYVTAKNKRKRKQ